MFPKLCFVVSELLLHRNIFIWKGNMLGPHFLGPHVNNPDLTEPTIYTPTNALDTTPHGLHIQIHINIHIPMHIHMHMSSGTRTISAYFFLAAAPNSLSFLKVLSMGYHLVHRPPTFWFIKASWISPQPPSYNILLISYLYIYRYIYRYDINNML